ncbi:MAG: sulfotransferase [Porphyrobacter sp.]|nr:sulfotransferase [Porphyrobacter sp.]
MSKPPRTPSGANLQVALRLLDQLAPALHRGERAKLTEIVRELVALRAPMGGQWRALAGVAARIGELSLAREALDLFIEALDGAPFALYQKVLLLEQSGALREAYNLMSALPLDVPNPASNAYIRGTQALYLGESEDARSQLERATDLQPQLGAAWLSLATSADLAREPELANRIVAAEAAMADVPPPQSAAYYYAKGKAHAERGEHDLAFAAFARGAAEMKSLPPYDREADRRDAEESVQGYSAPRIAEIAGKQSEPTSRSIFVTGIGRSGTTLVEQILSCHSAVGHGGEINRLFLLASEIGGHSYSALNRYVGAEGPARAAQLWHHWLDERVPGPGRVVDKTPNTTRHIGLAAALLPEAPLIWLTRDPLDRAWSCFRTFFPASIPWSYDLEDIAFFFRLEDRLLSQWREILGDRLLVVPYESLVAEPDPWIRRILAHCGLPEEPGVFAPHESKRSVTTASVMQVRRPINRDGIGSAEPYREFLKPFIAAYYG